MADNDTTTADTPAKKPARRRSTTPAKAAAKTRTPRAKAEGAAGAAVAAAPKKPKAPPKPRSTKRQPATRTAKVTSAARSATDRASSVAKTATDKVGGKWGAAAIAGGLAAAGAAAAALLTLRGSSAKPGDPAAKGKKAHQPDGTDSSKSFEAGIADENTVPDKG